MTWAVKGEEGNDDDISIVPTKEPCHLYVETAGAAEHLHLILTNCRMPKWNV